MRALIIGSSGQDGRLLSELSIAAGDNVIGLLHRRSAIAEPVDGVRYLAVDYTDAQAVAQTLEECAPDVCYNFAALSTGHGMYDDLDMMHRINVDLPIALLNRLIANPRLRSNTRFVQAGSSEIFGDSANPPQGEETPATPISPYAVGKLYVHQYAVSAIKNFGVSAVPAILFTHESIYRSRHYFTGSLIQQAIDVREGRSGEVRVGNLDAVRDWGCAREYCMILRELVLRDWKGPVAVGSGRTYRAGDVVSYVFRRLGLDESVLCVDPGLVRQELRRHTADTRLLSGMGLEPSRSFYDVLDEMIEARLPGIGLEEAKSE